MSILLSIKNLTLMFGQKVIFDGAELSIHKGDRIGLIGLNGQGKSTLFQILLENVKPDHTSPPFLYDKSNEPFETFLIPQELNIKDFAHLSIEDYYLAFYPTLYELKQRLDAHPEDEKTFHDFDRLGGWEIQSNYINYLKGFELDNIERSVESLSGGEKRKMALSIGLSSNAELLLWDEPTNHLDIETIERFEDELQKCNKTYMIISHDRYLLNHVTDRICHIERGKITTFKGTYLDYLVHLEDREKELLKNLDKLENRHRRELAWMRQGVKARRTRSKKRVEGFNNIQDGIKDIKSRARKVVDLNLLHSGRKSRTLIQIDEGAFSYPDKEILSDINLMITKKDKIALIGPNGAGKSTLINVLRQKLELTSGRQKNLDGLKVVVFDQNRESLDPEMTPLQAIGEGNDFIILGDGQKKHINSYLSNFLFTADQVNRPIETLSGGEKNRLQLAIFMKQAADLWIFDEPTNDLDIETIELLEKELKSYDAAVIIIGHDRAFLDNTCNSTWLIHDKKLEIFQGGYTQVAPYLHALEIEKEISKNKPTPKQQPAQDKPPKTTKNRSKIEDLESKISDLEEKIARIDEKLETFDYSDLSEAKKSLISQLENGRSKFEKDLHSLLETWEDLQT